VRRPGQPEKNLPRSAQILSFEAAEDLTGIKHQQVSRWRNSLKDEAKYRGVLFGPSYKKAMAGVLAANRGVETTHENDWFTPQKYIELARQVLGRLASARTDESGHAFALSFAVTRRQHRGFDVGILLIVLVFSYLQIDFAKSMSNMMRVRVAERRILRRGFWGVLWLGLRLLPTMSFRRLPGISG
jgi:hypothetical protein